MKPREFDKTDPLYRQLLGDDEVIQPPRTGDRERDKRQKSHDEEGEPETPKGGPNRPARDFAPELPEFTQEEATSMFGWLRIIIPSVDDTPKDVRRHRVVLSYAVLILIGFTAMANGWLSFIGLNGFAHADIVTAIRVDQLWQQVILTTANQCTAVTDESKRFYATEAGRKLAELNSIQSGFPLPTCEQVRVK